MFRHGRHLYDTAIPCLKGHEPSSNTDVTEASNNNVGMRSRPVQTGAIHSHKHYCYGLRKKKADDLFRNKVRC